MNGAGMETGMQSPTCIRGGEKISAWGGGSTMNRAMAVAPPPAAVQLRVSGPGWPAWKPMVPVPWPQRRVPLLADQV